MTIEPEPARAQQSPVTAIDIALEPDQTMVSHAQSANAALLKNFPGGFSLDATHHPHVSIFAGFVPTADLPKVYAAAKKVLAAENYTAWKLTAFKYYYIPMGPTGLGGIVVKPTPDRLRLQQELIDAVAPYTVRTATAAAFYTTPKEPNINPSVIAYIAAFMTKHSGKNFSPHVTIGIGTTSYLEAMLAKPFIAFTFSLASASVYQFGDYGAPANNSRHSRQKANARQSGENVKGAAAEPDRRVAVDQKPPRGKQPERANEIACPSMGQVPSSPAFTNFYLIRRARGPPLLDADRLAEALAGANAASAGDTTPKPETDRLQDPPTSRRPAAREALVR
jgi:hypothetical protein